MTDAGMVEGLLLPYLPSQQILGQFVISTIIAFVVVQVGKTWRRDTGRRLLRRSEMTMAAMMVSGASCLVSLLELHGVAMRQAVVYASECALLSPLSITVGLWLLDKFAPDLRRRMSQERRRREQAAPGLERRGDEHTTTRFL